MSAHRLAWLGGPLLLTLVGCQLVTPQPQPQPRLGISSSVVGTPIVPASQSAIDTTYMVSRGTLRDAITLPGKVAPARAAQLRFPNGHGTVTAINVRAGDSAKAGTVLAELRLNDADLQTAQRQARLAQLSAESQAAKVQDLKTGASGGALADARAAVTRAQADVQAAVQARADASQPPTDKDVAKAQLAADQASQALQLAEDDLRRTTGQAAALADAERRRAQAQASDVLSSSVQDAQVKLDAASATTRSAERRLSDATARLADTQTTVADAKAQRARDLRLAEIDNQDAQAQLAEARQDETRAEELSPSAQLSDKQIADTRAIALSAWRAAQTRVASAAIKLDQARAAAAAVTDEPIRELRVAVDQATDDVAQARIGEQRARDALALLQSRTPTPQVSAVGTPGPADVVLQAVRARATVETANLDQVSADYATAVADRPNKVAATDRDLAVKQAALTAASARLNDLQAGSTPDAILREEQLAELLRNEADSAQKVAQPTSVITAPFDGIVTGIGVSVGQEVDTTATIIRFAGPEGFSVIANVSETDVAQLTADQSVQVTFTGFPDQIVDGTVVEVGGVATTDATSKGTSYPVRVDLVRPPSGLKVGMGSLVTLSLREIKDALSIPSNTLRQVNGQTVVSRIDPNGQVVDVPIRTGATFGTDVEVTNGLNEGDVVAVYRSAPLVSGRQ